MKPKHVYLVLILVSAIFLTMLLHFRKPESKLELKMRQGELSSGSEWVNTSAAIRGLIDEVNAHPENLKAKLNLAWAYIQESRISGEHAYYDATALELTNAILKKEPENFDAMCAKATILLSQHHFEEALDCAMEALPLNPYNAAIYGILTDAYVELGKYEEAITMADKMVSVRPDLRSYSRVSYLRELYGNSDGAIEAMKLAVSAGVPGMEQTAWVRTRLGHLYEMKGSLDSAGREYNVTLIERPDYPYALAGLGRIAKAKRMYALAAGYFEKANSKIKEYSFSEELSEVYLLMKDPVKASSHAHKAVELLTGEPGSAKDGHGHYADGELALAYLKTYDYSLALKHALIEYNRRPDNMDVNETLGWVWYKLGKYEKANDYIGVALRTGSRNPELLYKAGMIRIKSGRSQSGISLMNESLKMNPYISPLLRWEGNKLMATYKEMTMANSN